MTNSFYTPLPRTDPRFPHFAPMLGAQPLLHEPERTLEQALADAAPQGAPSMMVRPDPWPEVTVGVGTAAISGAITGGVAAGSWNGAGIGAGLCMTGWSAFTLVGSYNELGSKAKTVLGVSSVAGLAAVGLGLWLRSRRKRGL